MSVCEHGTWTLVVRCGRCITQREQKYEQQLAEMRLALVGANDALRTATTALTDWRNVSATYLTPHDALRDSANRLSKTGIVVYIDSILNRIAHIQDVIKRITC